jgi:hypothetical protein
MGYRVIGDVAMVLHLAFLGYVLLGGFLAWRWRRTIWLHLAAAGWGFSTVLFGLPCPLTDVENWAREEAGQAGLSSAGFVDHYLSGVIYPQQALGSVRALVAGCVLLSWVGFVLRGAAARRHQMIPG